MKRKYIETLQICFVLTILVVAKIYNITHVMNVKGCVILSYILVIVLIFSIIGGSPNVVYTRRHSNTINFIGEQAIGVSVCDRWQDHYFLTGLKMKIEMFCLIFVCY